MQALLSIWGTWGACYHISDPNTLLTYWSHCWEGSTLLCLLNSLSLSLLLNFFCKSYQETTWTTNCLSHETTTLAKIFSQPKNSWRLRFANAFKDAISSENLGTTIKTNSCFQINPPWPFLFVISPSGSGLRTHDLTIIARAVWPNGLIILFGHLQHLAFAR